jgi:hypothetical protein
VFVIAGALGMIHVEIKVSDRFCKDDLDVPTSGSTSPDRRVGYCRSAMAVV